MKTKHAVLWLMFCVAVGWAGGAPEHTGGKAQTAKDNAPPKDEESAPVEDEFGKEPAAFFLRGRPPMKNRRDVARFPGDLLELTFGSEDGHRVKSFWLMRKTGGGGSHYSLAADSDFNNYVDRAVIALGEKQNSFQLVYDTEYEVIEFDPTTGREIKTSFRTPKKTGVRLRCRMKVTLPAKPVVEPAPPRQAPVPEVELTYDAGGLTGKGLGIGYKDAKGGWIEVPLAKHPRRLKVFRLGGELVVFDPRSLLVACYIRKVDRRNIGSLLENSDVSFRKNKRVSAAMDRIPDIEGLKGAGLFMDSRAGIPVARVALDAGGKPPVKFEAYAGKWNVRWVTGEGFALSYDVEITEDGKMIRLDKKAKPEKDGR